VVFFGYAKTSPIDYPWLMVSKISVVQSTGILESGLNALNSDGESIEMGLARQLVA